MSQIIYEKGNATRKTLLKSKNEAKHRENSFSKTDALMAGNQLEKEV